MLTQAAVFLTWLAGRGHSITECAQADIDAWYAETSTSRRQIQSFLRWCADNRTTPRLRIPPRRTENPAPISQHRRIAVIRRVLNAQDLPPRDQIVALLVLLYAQPISRIVRLTLDDVLRDGDHVRIRLGDPPSPTPEPFATLLLTFLNTRPNTTTATNPDSRWLFPGRRAGQPMDPATIRKRLHDADIPLLNGRTAAIRQLLLQAPTPVVAEMLGYHSAHAELLAAQAGGTWKTYAPGDHTP